MDVVVKGNHELTVDPITFIPKCITCNVLLDGPEEIEAHLNGSGHSMKKEFEDYEKAMKGMVRG